MKLFIIIALLSLSMLVMSCSEESIMNSEAGVSSEANSLVKPPSMSGNTIVDIASGAPDFSILVDAVVFADLAGTLSGNRQFTVFAPTNDAFVDLLNTLGITADELFQPQNKALVTKILLYHVAPGERFAADVVSSDKVRTMAKEFAHIKIDDGAFIGNDTYGYAEIVDTDIDAANGVIHVINKVIVPPSAGL